MCSLAWHLASFRVDFSEPDSPVLNRQMGEQSSLSEETHCWLPVVVFQNWGILCIWKNKKLQTDTDIKYIHCLDVKLSRIQSDHYVILLYRVWLDSGPSLWGKAGWHQDDPGHAWQLLGYPVGCHRRSETLQAVFTTRRDNDQYSKNTFCKALACLGPRKSAIKPVF